MAECYGPGKGRPTIDPELALRMMLLAEMRWFCGLNVHDLVPDGAVRTCRNWLKT